MLKLEDVALELFEYKVEEVRARRTVRGGLASVWDLYHHLQRQLSLLAPDERRRLELAERALRRISETGGEHPPSHTEFADLVLNGDAEDPGAQAQLEADIGATVAVTAPKPDAAVRGEQASLQRLAAAVWRHDLDRFVRRIAGGLRAERDRYTARLLYAVHRNLHQYLQSEASQGDVELARFRVVEAIPEHDDPFFSSNDLDSLAELVRETIDFVLTLNDPKGPGGKLGVPAGSELDAVVRLARAVAGDPYAGRTGLLQQKGPTAQQLRVAMSELGKERMRDEERLSQRRSLEERLQRVLAFERNQRQMFYQDVSRFGSLVDAFFDRLARYLPRSVGGEAGAPRLPGGVLFAANPALRAGSLDSQRLTATVRLKGPTRLTVAGLEVSVSGAGGQEKLYLAGEEHELSPQLAVRCGRRWLFAFKENEYLHIKVEDETRSVTVRVAEAAAVLTLLSSPQRDELLAVIRVLANVSAGEPQELISAALENMAGFTAQAPDRATAVRGFILGSARAAGVELSEEVVQSVSESLHRAITIDPTDLAGVLEQVDLGEVTVHPLTGEPLAVEAGSFTLTVRQYRAGEPGAQESLVVMLPGHALGTFEEYLIEPLGEGTLVCVKGEQELVVGYLRKRKEVTLA